MNTLTNHQRAALRAQAHQLKPVVLIGDAGLSPSVLKEIDQALNSHELIKVRIFGDDREARLAMQLQITETLHADCIQHIGKLLVLWRINPDLGSRSLMAQLALKPSTAKRQTDERASNRNATRRYESDRDNTRTPRRSPQGAQGQTRRSTQDNTRRRFGDDDYSNQRPARPTTRNKTSASKHPLLARPHKTRQVSAKKRALDKS